jgi:PIN domain nuclease of toxin-antitoxin system
VSSVVLDSSALLAALFVEDGAKIVEARGHAAIVSAVNYSEVLAKAVERGAKQSQPESSLASFSLLVVPFDRKRGYVTASYRRPTRHLGLSLGDRACLALGSIRQLSVLTADRTWAAVDVGVTAEIIR